MSSTPRCGDGRARHDPGRPSRQRRRRGAAVGLDDADHDVAAVVAQAPALFEHLVGLADAGRGAEQHPQPAPAVICRILPIVRSARQGVEREVELQHVDARLAEEPEVPCLNPGLHQAAHLGCSSRPRAAATRSTCSSAYAGLMCGSRPEPDAVTASAGISAGSTPSSAAIAALRSSIAAIRSVFSGP